MPTFGSVGADALAANEADEFASRHSPWKALGEHNGSVSMNGHLPQ